MTTMTIILYLVGMPLSRLLVVMYEKIDNHKVGRGVTVVFCLFWPIIGAFLMLPIPKSWFK